MKNNTLLFGLLFILFITGCKKDEDKAVDFISAYQGDKYSGPVTAVYNLTGESNPMTFSGLATFGLKDIQGDDVTLSLENNITNIEPFTLNYPGRQQGRSWVIQLPGIQGTLTIDGNGAISGIVADSDLEHQCSGNISRNSLQLEIVMKYLKTVNGIEAGSVVQLKYDLKR